MSGYWFYITISYVCTFIALLSLGIFVTFQHSYIAKLYRLKSSKKQPVRTTFKEL